MSWTQATPSLVGTVIGGTLTITRQRLTDQHREGAERQAAARKVARDDAQRDRDARFRREFHACLTSPADELSELADAVLCADGPVKTLAGLSLVAEHRRGHGALYDAGQ